MAVDPDSFRAALSTWASGVTIVTAAHEGRVHGMTVSAFASVSLDPPLVLVCADKGSNTLGFIEKGRAFAVNILARGQEELSNRFASKKLEAVRFDGLQCETGATGCPHIPGAVTYLDCRVRDAVDAGDHVVYVGSVEAVQTGGTEPLVYFQGRYQRLT